MTGTEKSGTASGVVGVLLAGGLARRMGGGDKCLRPLGPRRLVDWAVDRARPQVATLVLNANGDPARFADLGMPIAPDTVQGFVGPLAGVLAGLLWTKNNRPDCPWIVTIATDTPFFPRDLVARMLAAVAEKEARLACAASRGQTHPVFGLWPVTLAGALEEALVGQDVRKIDAFTARYPLAVVEFESEAIDPFFNANSLEDLAEAERLIEAGASP